MSLLKARQIHKKLPDWFLEILDTEGGVSPHAVLQAKSPEELERALHNEPVVPHRSLCAPD